MTLRDELEAKLRGIYVASKNDVFGEIADEVIRQMEWAWLTGEAHADPSTNGLAENKQMIAGTGEWAKWTKPSRGDGPLHLAPEGWKP